MKISTFQILSWDYEIQHILMIINVVLLFISVISPISLVYVGIYQIFFGLYQLLISSNVFLISKSLSEQIRFFRRVFVWSAWGYVGILLFFNMLLLNDFLNVLIYFVLPQVFMVMYYLLTRQELKSRKRYFEMRPMLFVR